MARNRLYLSCNRFFLSVFRNWSRLCQNATEEAQFLWSSAGTSGFNLYVYIYFLLIYEIKEVAHCQMRFSILMFVLFSIHHIKDYDHCNRNPHFQLESSEMRLQISCRNNINGSSRHVSILHVTLSDLESTTTIFDKSGFSRDKKYKAIVLEIGVVNLGVRSWENHKLHLGSRITVTGLRSHDANRRSAECATSAAGKQIQR